MPVLVTGVERATGRAVARRLAGAGGEVRVFLDLERAAPDNPTPWRRLGCKVAQGALDDEGHLETALAQTHTVLHLADSPLDDPARTVAVAATVLAAALGAGCRRLLWLSHLGAATAEANPWLAALGEVEALLADTPLETVILRRSWTRGDDDLAAALATAAVEGGRHWAVDADDLAAAAVHLDRERIAGTGESQLLVTVCGSEPVTGAALIGGARARLSRMTSAPGLPGHARELLAREQVPPAGAMRLAAARTADVRR